MTKSWRFLIVSVLVTGALSLASTALASTIYAEVPVPTTPCKFVVEGDVDTRQDPPAWAHGGLVCAN